MSEFEKQCIEELKKIRSTISSGNNTLLYIWMIVMLLWLRGCK